MKHLIKKRPNGLRWTEMPGNYPDGITPRPFPLDAVERIKRVIQEEDGQLREFASLLLSFNESINLISRKSVNDVYKHHVLHSLIFAALPFSNGSVLIDWGAGGGLPTIPLAIVSPDSQFVAVDKVEKKTRAIKSMAARLKLPNVEVWSGLADSYVEKCHYSVSRATAPLEKLWSWHVRAAQPYTEAGTEKESKGTEGHWKPGLICLKGGDLTREIEDIQKLEPEIQIDVYDLTSVFSNAYYDQKVLLHAYL